MIFQKLKAYDDFVRTYFKSQLTATDDDCFYAKILPVRGKKIAVIGLNSAWMCGLDSAIDRGSGLLLGESTVLAALAQA